MASDIVDISEVLLILGLSASATDEERAVASLAITRAEGAVRRHLLYDPVQRSRVEFYPMVDYNYQATVAVWESEGSQAILRRRARASTNELQVQHIPVRDDPAIDLRIDYDARSGTRDGSFALETLKVEGSDFWPNYDGHDSSGNALCRDGLMRSIGRWPTSPGSVRIVYTAGYTPEELRGQDASVDASPIWDAVLEEAVRRTRKAFIEMKQGTGWMAGPLTSEKLGDYAYTISTPAANQLFGGLWDLLPESREKLSEFINMGWALGG